MDEEDDKEDDDTDDEDEHGHLNDESFTLIGRRCFCEKLKIPSVGDGLQPPATAFEQKSLVEVMGAILSSGMELTELRLCPHWEIRNVESSTLQKMIDIRESLASRVHGRRRPRQIASLKTLYTTADAQVEEELEQSRSVYSAIKPSLILLTQDRHR